MEELTDYDFPFTVGIMGSDDMNERFRKNTL